MECPRTQLGAANLVDHVLPDVPIRQFVVTMPFPLRFPLAFDGKLLDHLTWWRNENLDSRRC
jgi:hypothetical protein